MMYSYVVQYDDPFIIKVTQCDGGRAGHAVAVAHGHVDGRCASIISTLLLYLRFLSYRTTIEIL